MGKDLTGSVVAVISGDIVGSRQINDKEFLHAAIAKSLEELNLRFGAYSETFRGDAFQILFPSPEKVILAAVMLRSWLISFSTSKKHPLDARLGVGIGQMDYWSEQVGQCDGPGFVLSGKALDELTGSHDRLKILTFDTNLNSRLALNTRFADNLISGWSHYSAEVVKLNLVHTGTQQELAEIMGKTQPTINKRLTTARSDLIEAYIDFAQNVIDKRMSHDSQ